MSRNDLRSKCKDAFVTGYGIRCIYGLFLALKSRRKSQKKESMLSVLRYLLISRDHFRFGVCLASATATYHFLHCALSSKHSDDPSGPSKGHRIASIDKRDVSIRMVAVVLSISWFKALPKEFRDSVALHLFVRAVYDVIKMWKDPQYGYLPQIPHDEVYFGAMTLTVMGIGIYHYPWLFDPSFYRFILKWGSNTHQQIGNVFRSKSDPLSPVESESAFSIKLIIPQNEHNLFVLWKSSAFL